MTFILPPDCGSALKNAPSAIQQKILRLLAQWPSTKGQSTPEYSKALRRAIKKLIYLWGGQWLNPNELTQTGKLYIRCSNDIPLNIEYFICIEGNGAQTAILIIYVTVLRIFKNWLAKKMASV